MYRAIPLNEKRNSAATDALAVPLMFVGAEHGFAARLAPMAAAARAHGWIDVYPSGSFDVVVAGNVLHLVPDLERALDACATFCGQEASSLPPPSFMTRHEPRVWCLAGW
jgi:hypothetical protein